MRSYAPASLAGDMGDTRSELGDSYPVSNTYDSINNPTIYTKDVSP